jgi:Protein of unknown function (DUF1559)
MTAPLTLKSICLLLATAAALAAAALAAPAPSARNPLPAVETAEPAIDPAKLADDADLRRTDVRNRTASSNNLKQIALAFHNFASANNKLPSNVEAKGGKALLSWRVLILPYIEENELYNQFKLDEPWNSKNNVKLLERMPKVFVSPRVTLKRKGYTVYQTFYGPDAVFGPGPAKYTLGTIPDGTSNTILAVESSAAVPWTKPADIPFDLKKDVPDFGKSFGHKPLAALLDGSVRILDLKKISAETLKNAINPADGNPLGADW